MIDLEDAERLAFEDAVAITAERDLLIVRGPDAASYLHGQVSQDVEGLAVGATAWTLLLQPQGKVDAWLRIHRRDEVEFRLDVEPGYGSVAQQRLERFKLRVEADIELATVPIVAVRGPCSATAVGDPAAPPSDLLILDASWGGVDGVDLFAADPTGSQDPTGWIPTGLAQGPAETLEVIRVRQGRPAMGRELDDSTIPAAAGVVDRSVDFDKGCYVGQELVARIDSRGNNTPTRLYGLRFSGSGVPAVGGELMLDGAASGTITSVASSPSQGTIGLAYLKRAVEVPARLETVSSDGDPQPVEAFELPPPAG